MTNDDKINAVIEYCETRLKQSRPLNGRDWIAGYEYVLHRILGIARTGETYHKCSEEQRKKEEIAFLKRRIKERQSYLESMKDKIPKEEGYIEELKERIAKLKKK
jgi:hypothetical protein